MGWGRVVLVVADYHAQLMVRKYLLSGEMGLTAAIFNVVFLPNLAVFVYAIKVKRAKESGGWLLLMWRNYQSQFVYTLNIFGSIRTLVGLDENTSAINKVVGVLALWIIVPFCSPSPELVTLMDVMRMFCVEDTVVCSAWRCVRVQSKGAV